MMNELLVTFCMASIIFIPVILMFVVGGVDRKHQVGGSIVVIIIWIIFTLGVTYEAEMNEKVWNNGFCECGTHWELEGVSKYRNHETKYYTCPNCYTEIEINN